jgi:putative ABC transport system permease protein
MLAIRNFLRAAFRHDALNREMNDELRAHLDRATERLMARGMSRSDADAAARREFGNVGVLTEQGRDARGASWVETLRSDARYALRALRRSPTFSSVAILSLAIGIGANTAIFGLLNALMLRPLPVEQPRELAIVGMDGGAFEFSHPLFLQLRDRLDATFPVAATSATSFNLADGGEERLVNGAVVSGRYFGVLGLRPAAGRLLDPSDDHRGCPRVAVVSHAFWQNNLGGRADVAGSSLMIDGRHHTVVGVAPRGFTGITVGSPESLFVPACTSSSLDARSYWWLTVLVRRGDRSVASVDSALALASRPSLTAAAPERFTGPRLAEFVGARFTSRPAATGLSQARGQYGTALFALMGMVAVVLLISCANVANLMLARGEARAREFAVRVAIGASRGRVVRQMAAEGVVLSIAAAAVGIVFANWTNHGLLALIGGDRQIALDVALDWRVLAFTGLVAIATVVICGLIPAWRATRVDPHSVMKAGGGARGGSGRFRIGRSLVVAQYALALTVVTTAGLLVGTLTRLSRTPLGFNPAGVIMARVDLRRERQGLGENVPLQRAVLDGIRGIPGVREASITNLTPVGRGGWNNSIVTDAVNSGAPRDRLTWFNSTSPGYFRTLQTRIVAGRDFSDDDTRISTPVAIVNEAAARRFFPGRSPIGQTLRYDEQGKLTAPILVVGVVENAKYRSVRSANESIVYLPAAQDKDGWATPTYMVRSDADAAATMQAIKAVAARVDPRMSLRFTTLEEQVAGSMQRERVLAVLSACFGFVALLLSVIGLYGVTAYSVARRRVEIGVRIALGAGHAQLVRMVLGDVARLTAIGMAIGAIGTFFATPLLGEFLFGMQANDPATIAGAVGILAACALLAGVIPARRAAALQPTDALRED